MTSSRGDGRPVPADPDLALAEGWPARRGRRAELAIVIAVGVGGAIGAVCRYAIALALPAPPGGFPWATFGINMSGSVVLGFLVTLLLEQFPRGRLARPLIGTGFIGAYTTFSTFAVEAVQLVRTGHPAIAAAYVLGSAAGGLAAAAAGMAAARLIAAAERWIQREILD